MGAGHVGLPTRHDHRHDAVDFIDGCPNDDLAIRIVDGGELARRSKHHDPVAASINDAPNETPQRGCVNGEVGVERREQRGYHAVDAGLKRRHEESKR